MAGERHTAPLLLRREGRGARFLPRRRIRQGRGDGEHAGVGPGIVCGHGGQCAAHRVRVGVPHRAQFRQHHRVLGERAGLVGAHHVDPRQSLDRGQFLNQALPLAQSHDTHRERQRGQQHQPLGHHRYERRDHAVQRRPDRLARGEQLVVDDEDAGRDHHPRDEGEDAVDAGPQFGVDERELARLLRELGRVGLAAHLRHPVGAAAGHHVGAGEDLCARRLGHRVGLTGEQRLVDVQRVRFDHLAVDHDLIARTEFDDVAQHHLVRRDLTRDAAAAHDRAALADDGERFERALRADLLHDADSAVGHDQQTEHRVDDRPRGQHDDQQHGQDCVDAREDVATHDVQGRPARAGRDVVRLALGAQGVGLRVGQSRRRLQITRAHPTSLSRRRTRFCLAARVPMSMHARFWALRVRCIPLRGIQEWQRTYSTRGPR